MIRRKERKEELDRKREDRLEKQIQMIDGQTKRQIERQTEMEGGKGREATFTL